MSKQSQLSSAEFIDHFLRRSALGVLLLALAYGAAALALLVGPTLSVWLGYVQLGLSLAILVVVFPSFWRYLRWRGRRMSGCAESDSYLAAQFQRASARAFSASFIGLVVLEVVVRKAYPALPAGLALNAILCLSLGVMSLAFFFFDRQHDSEEDPEEDHEEGAA
jgi:hypothetical protein